MRKLLFLFTSMLLFSCAVEPNKKLWLPALLTDNMVLQQQTEVMFWGTTKAEKEITVTVSWGGEHKVKAEKDGTWKATLKTPKAGGPYSVAISTGDTTVHIQNVLIGEVWLASGQSNMEMPLKGWPPTDTINYSQQEVAAANYDQLRLFTVVKKVSDTLMHDVEGQWAVCNPENAKEFSAAAYFFARELHQQLNVPIGIIHASWGGTPAESWVSGNTLAKMTDFKPTIALLQSTKAERVELLKWLKTQTAIEHPLVVDAATYASMDFKDQAALTANATSWPTMHIPQFWEDTEMGDFDGVIWFKKEFELTQLPQGEVTLRLGPVDDMDVTYINGVKVGGVLTDGAWQVRRNYALPDGLLKVGKNTIDVRCIDLRGGGGIWGGGAAVCLHNQQGDTVPLDGKWSYMPVAEFRNNAFFLFDVENQGFKNRPKQSIQLTSWTPTSLYNAMIYPLVNYKVKGAIWYQGESNVGRAEQYESLFPALISDWRSSWNSDFPFYFVQIAPCLYEGAQRTLSAALRDAQRKTLALSNTGMVVTMDIGNIHNIHPANKQDVGKRLANLALKHDYGKADIVASGPVFKSTEIDKNRVIVYFDNAEGLTLRGGQGFEVAGEDRTFYTAIASVQDDKLVVESAKVVQPTYVRYAWSDTASAVLFNGAGLPASSFKN